MKLPRLLVLVLVVLASCAAFAAAAPKKIVLLAGHASHGPLEHEHRAGCRLLQKCLAGIPGVIVVVFENDWPTVSRSGHTMDDTAALESADAILIYSDGGGAHPALAGDRLAVLARLMRRGIGLGLLHYAVEPTREMGEAEFLAWTGGAFAVNWSVNPAWTPEFLPLPTHPVTRGVRTFTVRDEWYFHLRFPPGLAGVTPILSAIPPASTMRRRDGPHEGNPAVRAAVARGEAQTVMWVTERADGGRGFGFTGGHYHRNWQNDDQRKLVLNALLWLAKVDVPAAGVASAVSEADLTAHLDTKPAR